MNPALSAQSRPIFSASRKLDIFVSPQSSCSNEVAHSRYFATLPLGNSVVLVRTDHPAAGLWKGRRGGHDATVTISADELGEVTVLLREWAAGKPESQERLFALVYPQLRRIARALFRGERQENLLQPTSVVNELFLKLIRQRSLRFDDREHFYSLSATLMRRVLLDHARSQKRGKRDGGIAIPLEEGMAWIDAKPIEMMDLDRVLNELETLDARKCRMAEFRFFLGFTAEETAELLHTSKATVDRELRFIRAWLYERLHSA